MKFRTVFAFIAIMPGGVLADEVQGWKIENDRGDVLVTTVSITSIAGDWCGIEPATLSLKCDDAQLSLRIESSCTPYVSEDRTASVDFDFAIGPFPRTKKFEVLADQKTLVLSQPFQTDKTFGQVFNLSSFGNEMKTNATVSLPELGRPDRDIIFDLQGMDDAVKRSGMQCGTQSLFD